MGELIGVNTAIYSPSGASAGVGFAIPVDMVDMSVEQIIKYGKMREPSLGILLGPDHILKRMGLAGALVVKTVPQSGAAAAEVGETVEDRHGRVHLGEVIVGLDRVQITNSIDLFRALEGRSIGDTVELKLARVGVRGRQYQIVGERSVKIRLQEKIDSRYQGQLGGQLV